jgi:hypothetical protein
MKSYLTYRKIPDINSLKPDFQNGIISVNVDLLKLVFAFVTMH